MRTSRLTRRAWALSAVLAVGLSSFAIAQEEKKEEAAAKKGPTAEELVFNLESPSGLAVQPETGHVFVASRYGIYRYLPEKHQVVLEISGYPTDVYGKGPMYDIGPLGLAFLDKEHLIVGDGSRPDGSELVRVYKVGTEPPEKPIKEDAAEKTLGPIAPGDASAKGEGNFYAIAANDKAVFISSNGDDTKGWILKIERKEGGELGDLTPGIATKELTEVDAPVPLIFSADGSELIVGQMGEVNVAGDALYTTYDPASGELKKKLPMAGLSDPAGLALSKAGKLYVTDFAWQEPDKAGLFRLDVGDEVKAEKVNLVDKKSNEAINLDKPTAIAFGKDGELYLTVFGTKAEGSDKSPGKLYVINGEL